MVRGEGGKEMVSRTGEESKKVGSGGGGDVERKEGGKRKDRKKEERKNFCQSLWVIKPLYWIQECHSKD